MIVIKGLTTNTTKATVRHIFSAGQAECPEKKLNPVVAFVVKVVTKKREV